MTQGQKIDTQTIVKLLAPKEIGVELVPLADIEQAEHSFFWASIFLSLFSTIFGAVISLYTTDYPNKPVLVLLLIFLLVFLTLFISFSVKYFKEKRKARNKATDEVPAPINRPPDNSTSMYEIKGVIHGRVFHDNLIIPETTFLERMKGAVSKKASEETLRKFVNLMFEIRLVDRETRGDQVFVRFNKDWDPEKYVEKGYPHDA